MVISSNLSNSGKIRESKANYHTLYTAIDSCTTHWKSFCCWTSSCITRRLNNAGPSRLSRGSSTVYCRWNSWLRPAEAWIAEEQCTGKLVPRLPVPDLVSRLCRKLRWKVWEDLHEMVPHLPGSKVTMLRRTSHSCYCQCSSWEPGEDQDWDNLPSRMTHTGMAELPNFIVTTR